MKSIHHIPALAKKNNLRELFQENLFTLVDVGATGGIDGNWYEIRDYCHYITFDPDPRAQIVNYSAKHTNYNIGLWSKKDTPKLYLTKLPVASSIYQHNLETLSSYLNDWCHQIVDYSKIEVNSLENTLKTNPDFIKIDAEGADLEILKGGEKFLKTSCLGIEVEVSFINRHKNAPYFSDIDSFLRDHDFVLMDIQTEKWIRKNNVFSTKTNPQLIWGNAIYMLSKKILLKRIQTLNISQRNIIFIKYITILLMYRFHDYAIEICEYFNNENITDKDFKKSQVSDYFNSEKIISEKYITDAKKIIKQSLPSSIVHLFKLLLSILISCFLICIFCFSSNKRSQGCLSIKYRLIDLAKYLLKISRLGPNNCCISGSS